MYATPMLMNSLSHGGSGLMGNMVGHSNHHQHPGSLSSMMHSTPSAIQNDIPEEDLPLPKFHEVFAFAMHASGKNGLKRGISGMGGKSSSNPAVAYDVSKRGKIEHNPGEETSG